MNWSGPAIILSARAHGEGAAIVQVLARGAGRYAGLVHGRRNKTALLQPGNLVEASWRARLEEHLGVMTPELVAARTADALSDRAALAALNSACAIALTAMPERDPHPNVFDALDLVLSHLGARELWPALYVRWELGLLAELGFALELDKCAMTGTRE
ncbi:MAG TPA: DNA repair protein RecO, partial [Alphaproteobacteria bacterium]|nr:DNA repair protein RecO [Alphaproteobacteria bacterium]